VQDVIAAIVTLPCSSGPAFAFKSFTLNVSVNAFLKPADAKSKSVRCSGFDGPEIAGLIVARSITMHFSYVGSALGSNQ